MPAEKDLLGAKYEERILKVAAGTGAGLPDGSPAQFVAWLETLAQWNTRLDLTAARSPDELVDLMIADALVLSKEIPAEASVVDVGTGAGAPGFALALARPDLFVTLVEPLQKRVAFLRTVLGLLGTPRVTVLRARGETLRAGAGAGHPSFDVAVGRAVLPPPRWLELGSKIVRKGGSVWLLLAREPPPAFEGWRVAQDLRYAWPLTFAERRAARYQSTGAEG